MPELNVKITGLVAGDTWKLVRTYSGLPTGVTIDKVYLTIKAAETDADPGVVQKSITSSATGAGQITDPTSTDGAIGFYVIVSAAESVLLTPDVYYYYDFQGIADDGAIYTFEVGKVKAKRGRTDATS
jgi:hypothetical protein